MRSYCALYVDAGYLLASAATRVTGTSLRGGVSINHRRLIDGLIQQAEAASGLPLLRVNWYDSGANPGGAPNDTQKNIGMLPRVKLRLGRLSPAGDQKGVDLRIGLDLATHGRNHVVDVIYLVSGDDDLTEAVEEAQGHGSQVVILAAPNGEGRPHAISLHLWREADDLVVIDPATIDAAVRPAEPPRPVEVPAASAKVEPETAVEAAGVPAVVNAAPTPAMVASIAGGKHRAAAPAAQAAPAPPPAAIVYTTQTGRPAVAAPHLDPELEARIDEVCRGVLATWSATATAQQRAEALAGRPYVPSELDRALLLDLSDRLGYYDINERTRARLRSRFWELLAADERH